MKLRDRIFKSYLDDGETILYVAHKHLLVLKIDSAKVFFFGILLPIIFYLFFPRALPIFVVWWVIGIGGMFYRFIDWYYDSWLLTNMGVVGVLRNGLFDITATRIEYHMIEGISYNIKGVLQTLFNYGSITIDKLGAQTSVVLEDASNPKKLERLVMRYQEKYVYDRSIRDHGALKDMLADMIAYHAQNKIIENPRNKKN